MRRSIFIGRILLILFSVVPFYLWNITPVIAEEKPTLSLYDRLGGVLNIAPVVDDFLNRLYVNKTLNANPRIKEARDRVPISYLKFHVTTMVCDVTGGPCRYTGRSMKESHQHLNITENEWQAMVADFKKSLDKFRVPKKEQDELIAVVGSTKGDIVMSKVKK